MTSYQHARRVILAGIGVSVVLAAGNILVGINAHSTAVLATGLEFAGDVLAATIVFIGMGVAARPADDNHPYGHGRFETLSAFIVGMILVTGGSMISYRSIQNIGIRSEPPEVAAILVLCGAVVLRGVMSSIKFRVARRIRSSALAADAWNDAVDIFSALAALVGVVFARMGYLSADHYGGFLVGLVVVVTGLRVVRHASLELADTMPPAELTQQIEQVARRVDGVKGIDKVMARKTGLQYHIDLHIEVDPQLTVAASHAIAGHVRAQLKSELAWVADVLVHVEPAKAS